MSKLASVLRRLRVERVAVDIQLHVEAPRPRPEMSIAPPKFENAPGQLGELTPTEIRYCTMHAEHPGWTLRQIAEALNMARDTAKRHREHAFQKLNVGNAEEFSAYMRHLFLGNTVHTRLREHPEPE